MTVMTYNVLSGTLSLYTTTTFHVKANITENGFSLSVESSHNKTQLVNVFHSVS